MRAGDVDQAHGEDILSKTLHHPNPGHEESYKFLTVLITSQ
jgi:hypothetical protein